MLGGGLVLAVALPDGWLLLAAAGWLTALALLPSVHDRLRPEPLRRWPERTWSRGDVARVGWSVAVAASGVGAYAATDRWWTLALGAVGVVAVTALTRPTGLRRPGSSGPAEP